MKQPHQYPLRVGLLVFLLWTVLGFLFLFQAYIFNASGSREFDWLRNFSYRMTNTWMWAVVTPLIYWLARRFPPERYRRGTAFLLHLGFSLLIAPLHLFCAVAANFAVLEFLGKLDKPLGAMIFQARYGILGGSVDSLVMYWMILAVILGINFYRKYQQHRLKSALLETRLARAQLQTLKMQLHPHFLFNTLHAISSLMDEDVRAARSMLVRLSELLRLTLDNAGAQEVPLQQELALLDRYLEIEQIRFQDRLMVLRDIAPETLTAQVPNLLLQPIVENALRHGIATRSDAGRIAIRAVRINGMLHLEVQDDGPGIDPQTLRTGIGLQNTGARLQQLYGDAQCLQLENAPEGGLRVHIELPFRQQREVDGND